MDKLNRSDWHLTPIRSLGVVNRRTRWLYRCVCGNETVAIPRLVENGEKRSCGCFKKAFIGLATKTHGNSTGRRITPELRAYFSAKERCYNPKNERFPHYGGRGIKMCEKWLNDPSSFLEDMGKKPSPKHSIDRINVDGDYEPTNCRWASPAVQNHNRSVSRWVQYKGVKTHVSDIPRHSTVTLAHFCRRIKSYGWDVEKAASTPCHPTRGRK